MRCGESSGSRPSTRGHATSLAPATLGETLPWRWRRGRNVCRPRRHETEQRPFRSLTVRFNLRTVAILGVVGVAEILGLGASDANAQWGRGRGPFGPRPFRRGYGYGVVYAPPVVVAPVPVVVTRPRYVYVPPTIIQRQYVQQAPLVETRVIQQPPIVERRVVQPPAYEESRVVQPPPVVERRLVQPPAYEENRVIQQPPVVERRVVLPRTNEEIREVQALPVDEPGSDQTTTDLSPPPIPTPE